MNKNSILIGLMVVGLSLFSCTAEKDEVMSFSDISENDSAVVVCDGYFNVVVNDYEGVVNGKSTKGVEGWSEGDKIYLLLKKGTNYVTAEALYSGGKWTVSLIGTPALGVESQCKAYFFEGAGKMVGTSLTLSDRTAIYEDNSGSYIYDGETITITASLKPKHGRVRFAGNKNTIINVFGVAFPAFFDASKGTFSYNSTYIADTVDASGYTPYIYGYLKDSSDPRLYVVTKNSAFTKYCDERVFKAGESGWLSIPTTASHFGWFEYLALKVNGCELNMKPVWIETASPQYMFLLSEYEVTEGLYNAAVGSGSKTSLKPKTDISYSNTLTFATSTMGGLTGLPFGLATRDEWCYAFGSNTYSGSEVINEVGWYSGNSDNMIHNVGELKANEYGLYDMSGNVAEWALSYSGSYGGSYYPYCGGNYSMESSGCTKTNRTTSNSNDSYSYVGIRLYLKF